MEISGFILALSSAVLLANKKILGWVTGILGSLLYMIVFYNNHIYANSVLQIIFIIQSIYGLWNWNIHRSKKQSKLKETNVTTISGKQRLIYGVLLVISIVVTYLFLISFNSTLPILDAIVAVLSVFANILLMTRKIESWIMWIIVDVLSIILFAWAGLYITSLLYMLFLINAIYGYIKWSKDLI